VPFANYALDVAGQIPAGGAHSVIYEYAKVGECLCTPLCNVREAIEPGFELDQLLRLNCQELVD
jgi:hypothetical protein